MIYYSASGGDEGTNQETLPISFLSNGDKLLVCNPFPVSVDLQDIVFTCWGETSEGKMGEIIPDAGCELYWWDPKKLPMPGYVNAYWNCWWTENDGEDEYEGPCWMDASDETPVLIRKEFAPGDGFYVFPSEDQPKIYFPNPFYKAAE